MFKMSDVFILLMFLEVFWDLLSVGSSSREPFDFAAGARQVHGQRVGATGAARK